MTAVPPLRASETGDRTGEDKQEEIGSTAAGVGDDGYRVDVRPTPGDRQVALAAETVAVAEPAGRSLDRERTPGGQRRERVGSGPSSGGQGALDVSLEAAVDLRFQFVAAALCRHAPVDEIEEVEVTKQPPRALAVEVEFGGDLVERIGLPDRRLEFRDGQPGRQRLVEFRRAVRGASGTGTVGGSPRARSTAGVSAARSTAGGSGTAPSDSPESSESSAGSRS